MILTFTREQIVALSNKGIMNKKSIDHWDICNDLRSGQDQETVAMKHNLSPIQVYKINRCKCPEVKSISIF